MTTNTTDYRVQPSPVPPVPEAGTASLWRTMLRLHRGTIASILFIGVAFASYALAIRRTLTSDPRLWDCYILSTDYDHTCGTLTDAAWMRISILEEALQSGSPQLATVVLVTALLVGTIVGLLVFAREFENRTHSLALTQGVSRGKWWATALAVTGIPLILMLLGLGLLTQWSLAPTLDIPNFYPLSPLTFPVLGATSTLPAAFGLMGFGVGAAIGVLTRRTILGLLQSVFITALVFTVIAMTYPHVVHITRTVTPISEGHTWSPWNIDDNVTIATRDYPRYVDFGNLDAEGRVQLASDACWESANAAQETVMEEYYANAEDDPDLEYDDEAWEQSMDAYNEAWQACAAAEGITHNFVDAVQPDQLINLRVRLTAILTALGAGGIWLSRAGLRSAVSKR